MSGRKKYKGEKYSFSKKNKLGKGGNGAVYDIEAEEIEYPVVAKFFEYEGVEKEMRYNRFKKEIEFAYKMREVDGIIPIIDKNLPQNTPKSKDEAWFLMPKAKPYKVNKSNLITDKIDDMMRLAQILKSLHQKNCAHRDIKPENILILNDKLMLSDYGLVWESEEDRLTKTNERIGPYRILPPELEHVLPEPEIDFRLSDVYLFAKVLWMTLKEDNIGFRGQYTRGDAQIYLQREKYSVSTFEPIHRLLEETTNGKPHDRINIDKCMEYLKLQKEVLVYNEYGPSFEEKINQFKYDEYSKEIIEQSSPSELSYTEKNTIYKMLKNVIPVANIYIKRTGEYTEEKKIYISDFEVCSDKVCLLTYFFKGRRIKDYQLNIKKMIYLKETGDILLELETLDVIEQGYVSFEHSTKDINNEFSKIYLTPAETIIVKKSN